MHFKFIQNFYKGKIYPIGENFVVKKFSLRKIFVTFPILFHFSPTKNFSSDIMNMFDLSWVNALFNALLNLRKLLTAIHFFIPSQINFYP